MTFIAGVQVPTFYGTSGPQNAKIMCVAESWGVEEAKALQPLVGTSGQEATRILADAGIDRNDVFLTNVISSHPQNNEAWRFFLPAKGQPASAAVRNLHPSDFVRNELQRLDEQIQIVKPKVIVAIGNYALWALTNHAGYDIAKEKIGGASTGIRAPTGILTWRGSQTYHHTHTHIPVLPIIHPAAILKQWPLRSPTVHDLQARIPLALADNWAAPERTFVTPLTNCGTDFDAVLTFFVTLFNRVASGEPIDIAVDIETHCPLLICIGIAVSTSYAISIPFTKVNPDGTFTSFWDHMQEAIIIQNFRRLFMHPRINIVGQNWIYDTQYIERDFGVLPKLHFDTMLAQHLVFPGLPKGLDYLSSLYCEHHLYWKDDGKEWYLDQDMQRQLTYNCIDCVRTLEVSHALKQIIANFKLTHLWQGELDKHELALRMMRRGVRIDRKAREQMRLSLMTQQTAIEEYLLSIVPQSYVDTTSDKFWFRSAQQTKFVLYEHFGLKAQRARKTGNESTGKEAMAELENLYPSLKKLFNHISAYRSLGVFQANFILKQLEPDGRMRCQYNPAGTETFRWSSSENAFRRGTNLQNIPSGNEDE